MRIVYVTQGYPPERVGGVEVYLKGLAREMARGHEVFVFSRGVKSGMGHGEVYESEDGAARVTRVFVDQRRLNEFRDSYMRPWLTGLFREYLKRVGPDVVHVQHLGGMSLDMVGAAAELGPPVVMTLSDHQPYCPRGQRIRNDKRVCKKIVPDECLECLKPQCAGIPGRPAKLAAYLMGKARGKEMLARMREDIAEQFASVSFFIMPSEYHRKIMVEEGVPAKRSHVLPYGLDLSELDKVAPRPAGEPVRRFAYLGTLIPSKGLEDVIRAFKKMNTPGCSLHIYGEAVPYHGINDYDKRLVELSRSAEISFYGAYQPEDLPRVLAKVDAIIMPSRWYESYGITIREAFRAKRPVIVSDVGAFAEAVEHERNGLKFAPGDVFELAAAMDRLAQEPELAERFAVAGGPMESLEEHAAKLVALYDQAREKNSQRGG
jgi:glycosyltransferase involved in cell wall biosynthesis